MAENLANKYRPKTWDDVCEQKTVVNILKKMCQDDNLQNRNFLFTGSAGCGKAQPLYSQVLTQHGFVSMGDIAVGDVVYTHTGKTATVSGIFQQGLREVYSVYLSDGRSIHVSDEHLNVCCTYDYDDGTGDILCVDHVYTTKELIDRICLDTLYIKCPVPSSLMGNNDNEIEYEILAITKIEPVGSFECQCIYVDHPDHTYISDGYIPTHNTTLCRIAANVLNDGNGDPIEIDAATHGNVESIRNLVAQARAYPVGSKWKIFIVDECHAISSAGWSAFLKCLEESPAKTIFFLATTNPEKIPDTIISRVQVFNLSKLSLSTIVDRLKYVIECENRSGVEISYEDSAISLIAKLANGGMRDALTLLDKAISFDRNLTSMSVQQSLSLPNFDDYFSLLGFYAKKDNENIISLIQTVYNSGVNFVKWFDGFHAFVVNVMKYIYLRNIEYTTIPSHYEDKISKYSDAHALVCMKLSVKLLNLNRDLRTTQYLQETAITYLCQAVKK